MVPRYVGCPPSPAARPLASSRSSSEFRAPRNPSAHVAATKGSIPPCSLVRDNSPGVISYVPLPPASDVSHLQLEPACRALIRAASPYPIPSWRDQMGQRSHPTVTVLRHLSEGSHE